MSPKPSIHFQYRSGKGRSSEGVSLKHRWADRRLERLRGGSQLSNAQARCALEFRFRISGATGGGERSTASADAGLGDVVARLE